MLSFFDSIDFSLPSNDSPLRSQVSDEDLNPMTVASNALKLSASNYPQPPLKKQIDSKTIPQFEVQLTVVGVHQFFQSLVKFGPKDENGKDSSKLFDLYHKIQSFISSRVPDQMKQDEQEKFLSRIDPDYLPDNFFIRTRSVEYEKTRLTELESKFEEVTDTSFVDFLVFVPVCIVALPLKKLVKELTLIVGSARADFEMNHLLFVDEPKKKKKSKKNRSTSLFKEDNSSSVDVDEKEVILEDCPKTSFLPSTSETNY